MTTAAPDDDALLDRVDDVEQRAERQGARDLSFERLQEELLARDAEEVGVEVAIANVGERVVAVEPLVAGPEVDRRVAARTGVVVEVAVVDVDPHAAELIDELQEAVEVDGDEVVDREASERSHRVLAALRSALRERRVDAVAILGPA